MLHNAHSQISTSSGQVKALRAHGVVTAWSNCPLCMMANPALHLESLGKKIGWYSPGFIRHLFAQRFGKIKEFCCRYLKKKPFDSTTVATKSVSWVITTWLLVAGNTFDVEQQEFFGNKKINCFLYQVRPVSPGNHQQLGQHVGSVGCSPPL